MPRTEEGQAMAVMCTGRDRVLRAEVSGEVDHHGAREIMGELERGIDRSEERRVGKEC